MERETVIMEVGGGGRRVRLTRRASQSGSIGKVICRRASIRWQVKACREQEQRHAIALCCATV